MTEFWAAKNKILMVFPHPDDETFYLGGIIQRLIANGSTLKLICLTNQSNPIRAQELTKVCQYYHLTDYLILDYPDGNLSSSKSDLTKLLQNEIEQYHPDYLITFAKNDYHTHPDHEALFEIITNLNGPNTLFCCDPRYTEVKKRTRYLLIKLNPKEIVKKLHTLIIYKSQFPLNRKLITMLWKSKLFYKEGLYC